MSKNTLDIIKLCLSLIRFHLSPGILVSVVHFIYSDSIGSNVKKITDRMNDLNFIINLLPRQARVLEFGIGFSSILFGYTKKISTIISIEESAKFVPQKLSQKNRVIISDVTDFETTRKFKNISKIHGSIDLYYIDGPQTPLVGTFSEPNIDLLNLEYDQIKHSIIAIDVRYKTVALVQDYLKNSHVMFISRRMENRIDLFNFVSPTFIECCSNYGSLLKLTTIFIPISNTQIIKKLTK